MSGTLTAQLEAALLREVVVEWRHVNRVYFRKRLEQPTFVLVEARSTLGRWVPQARTIELSRALVVEQPWSVVVEVLKHEVAHQWVHEGLGRRDETAHGPTFRETCARLGIDAAASGLPTTRGEEEERILARIARLLALAESPNVHEAESAMAAAQKLMLKHNLEAQSAAHARGYAFRHVGLPKSRVGEHERTLASLLAKYFFVEAIWVPIYVPLEGRRLTVLELCGTPANLEIAEYVHGYLRETAERLWSSHRAAHAIRGDRDRRTYLSGVMSGFAEKLGRQAATHRGEGLVWVGDRDLDDYLRRRHPHVRTVWTSGPRRTESFSHGKDAGRSIVLHKPMRSGAEARGRLLGSGS
jgi:hypothetical protein